MVTLMVPFPAGCPADIIARRVGATGCASAGPCR